MAEWRPRGAGGLAAALERLERVLDAAYGSRANPLHHAGTLTALFLGIAVVTGVYLLFVYEIGRPYESLVAVQGDVALGRWIRALHRYASDAAVVTAALHAARALAHGKTWGPRALAWISGIVLTGMLALSGITGLVLVWDVFAQTLAVAGARMLRLLPLFVEPPDRAFAGDRAVASAFFFMNLFLHVAIPLGMIGVFWLHTSRLARAAWFPGRRLTLAVVAALVALALVWPAPLPPPADLLAIPGVVESDWFYGFWLPLAEHAPGPALVGAIVLGVLLLATPWVLRPPRRRRLPVARVDPARCEGCRQCFADCPYDAIRMVPGTRPGFPLRADVLDNLCVSCGICAASCASLAIGPPERTARDQLAWARTWLAAVPEPAGKTAVVMCANNARRLARERASLGDGDAVRWLDVECAGTLHPATIALLGGRFARVVVAACPTARCTFHEGGVLAEARLVHGRRPALSARADDGNVRVVHHGPAEWRELAAAITGRTPVSRRATGVRRVARAALAGGVTAVVLGGLALGSRAPHGTSPDHGVLRLGWRLTGTGQEICRDVPAEELARRPVHMRTPRECRFESRPYALEATVDGRVVLQRTVRAQGLRGDLPVTVEEEIAVPPGEHDISVSFAPTGDPHAGMPLQLSRRLHVARGRVVLITTANGMLTAR